MFGIAAVGNNAWRWDISDDNYRLGVANSKVCLEPMNSFLSTEVQASVYIALIRGLVINQVAG